MIAWQDRRTMRRSSVTQLRTSRKPSSRIRFEFQSPCRTISRPRASQQTTLCFQTISSCSHHKRWQSLEGRWGRSWLPWTLYRLVLGHYVGGTSDLSWYGLNSTFLSFPCLFDSEPTARAANGCSNTVFPLVR